MCRSRNEPGGPRRCPSHARSQLRSALNEVADLEFLEENLFRAACVRANEAIERSSRDSTELRECAEVVQALRWEARERGVTDELLEDYRGAYRDEVAARRGHTASRQASQLAIQELENRRDQAHQVLVDAGAGESWANERLDQIERDTNLAPPF